METLYRLSYRGLADYQIYLMSELTSNLIPTSSFVTRGPRKATRRTIEESGDGHKSAAPNPAHPLGRPGDSTAFAP